MFTKHETNLGIIIMALITLGWVSVFPAHFAMSAQALHTACGGAIFVALINLIVVHKS